MKDSQNKETFSHDLIGYKDFALQQENDPLLAIRA